jgi:hypothetical protein
MKKKIQSILIAAAITLGSGVAAMAQLQLPAPSPAAMVMQTAGLTEITVEYSSPGVKGRSVFGSLVPYNELWRTGANSATKINFSKDVTIEGNKIPKGKYSLFTIPGATEFTVILNKDLTASVDSYKKEEDVARFMAKVKAIESRERLTFLFSNTSDTQTTVDMEWDKVRVSFNVMVDTDAQAKENIDKELGRTWRTYNSAARYHLDNKKDLEGGMKYADISISLKEDWFNVWTKAQLFAAMGKNADAHKWALKAKELGDKSGNFFYKDNVEKAIVDWKPTTDKKGKK